jgi:peptidoglycan/LPS O-acetylase OafA/YrhL
VIHFPSYYGLFAPYAFSYTLNYTRLMEGWLVNPLFTHLWTLSIEEQFYLLFPVILFLCPPRMIKTLLVLVLFISPLSRYLLGEYYKANLDVPQKVMADAVYWNTLSHLDAFCIGGLIPVFSLDRLVRRPRLLLGLCLLLVFVAGLASYFSAGSTLPLWQDWGYQHMLMNTYQHVWQYTCINLCCAALILFLVSPNGQHQLPLVRKFFETRWMVRIGKVSYGMYVFHWLVLVYGLERFFPNQDPLLKALCFIPYVATVYLMAEASYTVYESYFIGLKDRLFQKKQKPQSTALTEAEAEAFKPM